MKIVSLREKVARILIPILGIEATGTIGLKGFKYAVEFVSPDGKVYAKWDEHNLVPTEAMQYFLRAGFEAGVQYSNFFIGAYTNPRVPLITDNSAILSEYGEIVSFEEGQRQAWNRGSLVGTQYDSSQYPTILTATEEVTIQGVFMSTSSGFGSASGLLMSVALAPSPEVLKAGGQLRIPANISMVNI